MTRAILVLLLMLGAWSPAVATSAGAGLTPGDVTLDDGTDEPVNTDDGDDEDDDDEDEDDEDNDEEDEDDDDDRVESAKQFTIGVECEFERDENQSTCEFKGRSPGEDEDVGSIELPDDEICAPVVGGDGERVKPDPGTRLVGYKSRGDEGEVEIVFEGEVTTGGSAIYWLNTGKGVFPARGPGLRCADEAKPTAAERLTPVSTSLAKSGPTATPGDPLSNATGAIRVEVLECPIASGAADTDWHGLCTPAGTGYRFRLAAAGQSSSGKSGGTDAGGELTFGNLDPGLYDLSSTDNDWCYAQSDSVDSAGNVKVGAGEWTTVWTFYCLGATS